MTAPNLIRGWCPSLFRPMQSGDGWLARVRPQMGSISADSAFALADAAARFGNGVIDITNRANIQIRGLRPDTIAPFTATIEAAGGAEGEGSRMLISPLVGADQELPADLQDIAASVDGVLSAIDLPAKFGIVIDGGGALPLAGVSLDITIRFTDGRWLVNGEACVPDAIPGQVRVLAGSRPPRVTARTGKAPKPGYHALGQDGFILVMPAFGQMTAQAFAGLARLAQVLGDGKLRPTPWKSLCVAGIAAGDAAACLARAKDLGFIADADDARLSIITCTGAPSCGRGEIETRKAAAELARGRRADDSLLHLSGCVKGCAYPGAAPVTLVGRDGKFDLIRDGRTVDMPAIRHQTLAQIAAVMQSLRP